MPTVLRDKFGTPFIMGDRKQPTPPPTNQVKPPPPPAPPLKRRIAEEAHTDTPEMITLKVRLEQLRSVLLIDGIQTSEVIKRWMEAVQAHVAFIEKRTDADV